MHWQRKEVLLFIEHLVYQPLKGVKVTFVLRAACNSGKLLLLSSQLFNGLVLISPKSDSKDIHCHIRWLQEKETGEVSEKGKD